MSLAGDRIYDYAIIAYDNGHKKLQFSLFFCSQLVKKVKRKKINLFYW